MDFEELGIDPDKVLGDVPGDEPPPSSDPMPEDSVKPVEATQPASEEPPTAETKKTQQEDAPAQEGEAQGTPDGEQSVGELTLNMKREDVPEYLRGTFDELLESKKNMERDYTRKTQSLAEQRRGIEKLSGYEGRSGDLDDALRIFDALAVNPSMRDQVLNGMNGSPQPPQPPQQQPTNQPPAQDKLQGMYNQGEELGYSKESIDYLRRVMAQEANNQIRPIAAQFNQNYVKPLEQQQFNQMMSTIESEIVEMRDNPDKYPYYEHLKGPIGDTLKADPNAISPKALYKYYNDNMKLDQLVNRTSMSAISQAEKNRASKTAALVQSPETTDGKSPPIDPGGFSDSYIRDAVNAATRELNW